jgi:hypothetical protein
MDSAGGTVVSKYYGRHDGGVTSEERHDAHANVSSKAISSNGR